MTDIAVVFPTRNRPAQVTRFIASMLSTASSPQNIKFYVYVDNDDQLSLPALSSISTTNNVSIKILVGEKILMSEMVNKLLPFVKEDIFFLGGDDLVMRTPGWDTKILEKLESIPDKIALLYGDDLSPCPTFATHPILHRNWVSALGYLAPPYFSADYADTWLNDISEAIGRKYKLDIINEHLHWTFGKANFDSTYLETRIRFQRDNPNKIYNDLKPLRDKDIDKLRKVMHS